MLENILGKLNVIKISYKELCESCLKKDHRLEIENLESFNELELKSYNEFYINKDINRIKVKNTGLYYDVDQVIFNICRIFGVTSLNIDTLEKQKDKFRSINSLDDIKTIGEATFKEFVANYPEYQKFKQEPTVAINTFKTKMIKKIDDLKHIYLNLNGKTKLNDICLNAIDMEKLELLINYKIVTNMQKSEFNDILADRCLTTVEDYLNKDNDTSIKINIDKDYIKNEYQKLAKKYKRNDTIKKEETSTNNFFEVDKTYNEYKEPERKITKYTSSKEQEKRENLLVRKITFYNGLDVAKKHIGNNSYKGYVGYELYTGKVILEKLYNDEDGKSIAYGEAIYIVKVGDLTILNNHSKTEVISKINNRDLDAIRILHSSNWEEKVNNAIKK